MKKETDNPNNLQHPEGSDHIQRRRRVVDYDAAEFFVPSADQQGHNDQYRFRAPKGYNRRMSELLAKGKFPFKTSTDILRYCLHIGLRRLDHMEPSSTVQRQLELMRQLLAEAEFQQEFLDTQAEIRRVMDRYIAQQDRGAARNLVSRLLTQIRAMPDETNWRAKYEEELLSKYGWLLKEGKGRKLSSLVQGE